MGTTPCMLNHETKQNGFTRLNSCAVSAAPPPIFWNMMFEVRLSCNVNLSISNNFTINSTEPCVCWFRRHRIRQLMRKEEDFRERVFDHGSQGDGGSIIPTSLFFTLYLTPARSRRLYKKRRKIQNFFFSNHRVFSKSHALRACVRVCVCVYGNVDFRLYNNLGAPPLTRRLSRTHTHISTKRKREREQVCVWNWIFRVELVY